MLELDLLLMPFFDEIFQELDASAQQAFVRLLEREDPELLLWFSRQAVPDEADLAAMVERILVRTEP